MAEDKTPHQEARLTAAVVSLIIGLLIQTLVWVWWFGGWKAEVDTKLSGLNGVPERLARIEEGQRYLIRIIETKRDRENGK